MCSLLNERVLTHCSKKNLINKNQIGFKQNSRTSDHLFTLKTLVKKYVAIGKEKLYVCFVDFQKAFDSVWHKGLFHKLKKAGIKWNTLTLIEDLYKKAQCAIKMNNRITEFFEYAKGVRRGCPLSSVLFNLYINDIFEMIDRHSVSDVYLDKANKINALMYADDLILISRTKEGLQRQIDCLQEYCQKWKIRINIKKTKTMIFNRGNKLRKTSFKIGDTPIENVKSCKYLRFSISAKNCSFQSWWLQFKGKKSNFCNKKEIKTLRVTNKVDS